MGGTTKEQGLKTHRGRNFLFSTVSKSVTHAASYPIRFSGGIAAAGHVIFI
jgi:hypothetical protein